MAIKYSHTNIITENWQKLAAFYQQVFGCVPVPPERDLSGKWLDAGTGVENAQLSGIHLRLPGIAENGPTLEILQYQDTLENQPPKANRKGFGHIAFHVDDVDKIYQKVLEHGGQKLGEITRHKIEGLGMITFVYMTDPDGNIVELQNWS